MASVYQRTKDKRTKYLEENKDVIAIRKRSYYLRATFGITIEQYDEMEMSQDGLCAICREPEIVADPKNPEVMKRLAVDHNHENGQIRGLLCQRCNMGLGYFRDDPRLLNLAADYLQTRQ